MYTEIESALKILKLSNKISGGDICGYVLQSETLLGNGICQEYFVGDIQEIFRLAIFKKTCQRLIL